MTQPTDLQSIPAESLNLTEHHIEQLKQLFPNVFTEGKIDFEALKSELGECVESEPERYQFTWAGKEQAKRIATTPSLGTLRPAPNESVNWDSTENLYIEGDNLEVLKLLQKSYFGKVKMIYIDPPYNTGKDFVYKDDFKDNLANYQRLTGQKDEEGNPLTTNSDSAGRYHSNWLNMMYPRLKLARNLLRDDGLIGIHIDEHEYANLEKVLNEIFGENNLLGTVVWDKRNPKGEVVGVAQQHEFVVFFSKNKLTFSECKFAQRKENAERMLKKVQTLLSKNNNNSELTQEQYQEWLKTIKSDLTGGELAYRFIDANGDIYRPVSMAAPDKPETRSHRPLIHPVTGKPCPVPAKGWRYPDKSMDELLTKGLILFGQDEKTQPNRKYLLKENIYENVSSLIYFGGSDDALSLPFENPKPLKIATNIIDYSCEKADIILDFFSGSATTAHATMNLNTEDEGNRKFILVQIPEPTPESSEARKAGYATIAEIGKERIRRAANKIKQEHPETQADLGFKVLKLDTSNIKKWNPNLDTLETDLLDAVDNILPDRTAEDLLYEVLIKYGLPLTLPIKKTDINSNGQTYQAWSVAHNSLVVCFDENITLDTVQAIANLSTPENPVLRVVFRDTSFTDDITKTNAIQRLKQTGIEDVLSI